MFPKETKILLIGDVTTMRQVIRGSLHTLGYEQVTVANSNTQAWQLIEKEQADKQPFQIIIADWNNATPDSLGLLKKVRGTPSLSNLPFFFVTSETDKKLVMQAIQLGVSGLLLKPFTPQMLQQKLDGAHANMLARMRSSQDLAEHPR
ncbi:response regulator [Hylemonella gracilis]|jgi:two-component system chemotaxis response regulator CheY|uniref:Response regulator n=1 Tax=Hylemonella gracilis TaxID=80880 RepID=A0A4P6UNA3_9BURK|nr:response regulator [Hylemonella gracilis]QBK05575.1 response regulator [Hylemonella gracilis]